MRYVVLAIRLMMAELYILTVLLTGGGSDAYSAPKRFVGGQGKTATAKDVSFSDEPVSRMNPSPQGTKLP